MASRWRKMKRGGRILVHGLEPEKNPAEAHVPVLKTEAEWREECQRADAADWKAAEERFTKHTEAVGKFLSEMYAVMVDPLEDGRLPVAETCALLLAAARETRQRIYDLEGELARLRGRL